VCALVQLHCNYCEILLQWKFYDGCSAFSTFLSVPVYVYVYVYVRSYCIHIVVCYMCGRWEGWLGPLFRWAGGGKNRAHPHLYKTLFDGQQQIYSLLILWWVFWLCLSLMVSPSLPFSPSSREF